MSFGDGNLHERCEQYRRQLGGVNAALRRSRQRERDLESLLRDAVGLIAGADWPSADADAAAWAVVERAGKMGVEV